MSVSAWIEEENIKPYANYREKFSRGGKGGLKKALEAIEEYVKGHPEALAYKVGFGISKIFFLLFPSPYIIL